MAGADTAAPSRLGGRGAQLATADPRAPVGRQSRPAFNDFNTPFNDLNTSAGLSDARSTI
jgi:hypothetical protein